MPVIFFPGGDFGLPPGFLRAGVFTAAGAFFASGFFAGGFFLATLLLRGDGEAIMNS